MNTPHINWIKNGPEHKIFTDGSEFLVAIQVRNSVTNSTKWDFDRVTISCDDDLFELRHSNGEIYDAWSWEDFEYFALLSGEMPYSTDEIK